MIVPMKKITLLLFHREKQIALRGLQQLGIVDLDMKLADSEKIRQWRKERQELAKAIHLLRALAHTLDKDTALAEEVHIPRDRVGRLKLIGKHLKERETLLAAIEELQQELDKSLLWGDVDQHKLGELRRRGISLYLYSGSIKFFERYDFKGITVQVLSRKGGMVRFAVIGEFSQPPVIPFERHELPSRSADEIRYEIAYLQAKLKKEEAVLVTLAQRLGEFSRNIGHLEGRILLEEARHSLVSNAQGMIYVITGYFPARQEAALRDFCDKKNLTYIIEKPQRKDRVPVKLSNSAPVKLFEPLTRIFSLPNYHELDPTPFFAPFFTLFFGLCLGDAGYGLAITMLSLLFLWQQKWRSLGFLVLVLGLSTMLSGTLLNTFFGENLFARGERGLLPGGETVTPFAAYTIEGKTTFPAMTLALMLGVVQLLLAFLLQAANGMKRYGVRYAIKPIGSLLMVAGILVLSAHNNILGLGFNRDFTIGPIAIGQMVTAIEPAFAQFALLSGALLFFLFNNPDKKILVRPIIGIWEFYQFTTGFLGDFLSYIRIFALGLAGGLLGNAFNQIAFMLLPQSASGPDFTSPLMILSILILIVGHTLNLALSALGSFVHPLRLTFVEFYKNMDFRGGGREYRPFRRLTGY